MTRTPKEEGRRGRQNRTAAQKSRMGTRLSSWAARNLWPGKSNVRGYWVRAMRLGVGGGGGGGEARTAVGKMGGGCNGCGLRWRVCFACFKRENSNDSYYLLTPQLLLF